MIKKNPEKLPMIDHQLFWPALILLLGCIVPLVIWEEQSTKVLDKARYFLSHNLASYYLWFTNLSILYAIFISCTRFGGIKLGDPSDKPEFSDLTWVAMLFAGGVGSSLVILGTVEWALILNAGVRNVDPGSALARNWAMSYGMFHWGVHAWSCFSVTAICTGYCLYIRKRPLMRLSDLCHEVIGDKADGPIGKVMDIFLLFGLAGGAGVSLGIGTPVLASIIGKVFNTEPTLTVQFTVLAIWAMLIGGTVARGLKKGIAMLSLLNLRVAMFVLAFVAILGPTTFILDVFTQGVGFMFQNFIDMSFYTDPYDKTGFPQWWTVFYWAWWLSFGVFYGMFFARISKGRTIRQMVLGIIVVCSFGCYVVYGVMGGAAMHMEITGVLPVVQLIREQGNGPAFAAIVSQLPLGKVLLPIMLVLLFIFLATTFNSAAFVLATVATPSHEDAAMGEREPAPWHSAFWACMMCVITGVLIYLGGLGPLQTAALVTSIPMTLMMIIVAYSGWKMMKNDEHLQLWQRGEEVQSAEGLPD